MGGSVFWDPLGGLGYDGQQVGSGYIGGSRVSIRIVYGFGVRE